MSSSVIVAIDDYRADSAKEGKRRRRRGGCDERRVYVTGLDQEIPKVVIGLMSLFKAFLKRGDAINIANCGKEEVWKSLPRVTQVRQRSNHEEP